MSHYSVRTNISLPPELLQELDEIAKEYRITRSEFMRQALLHYLEIIRDRTSVNDLLEDLEERRQRRYRRFAQRNSG